MVPGGGLEAHELFGGHTLDRHVGKSVEFLKERFIRDPKIMESSSFYNRAIAENSISKAIHERKIEIDEWLQNPQKPFLVIEGDSKVPIGHYIARNSDVVKNMNTFCVVLVIDKKSPIGYKIKTAYPTYPKKL